MTNIVLIAIDTLRADRLSCYGHKNLTSPHLDRIAENGVLFEECFSPFIPTHPGFTTMFTGVDAIRHQVICQGGKVELTEDIPMLAEVLKESGYFTAGVDNLGRWFNRGYDLYQGYKWQQDPEKDGFRKAEAVNKVALESLEACASQDTPFYLFLHYWDPHTPYLPPSPFKQMFYQGNESDPDNRSMDPLFACPAFGDYFKSWMGHVTDIKYPSAQYDSEIAYVDAVLESVFTRMRELGIWEDTLLVIVSDHGEELDEHKMWFDHHGLYDTNLHVPLIFHCPAKLPAGKRVRGMVRLTDLAPTILDFIGHAELAGKKRMEGKTMVPLMKKDTRSRRGTCDELFLIECSWMKKKGYRNREWKLITALEPDYHGTPDTELYFITEDPKEENNVADAYPHIVRQLKTRIDEWVEKRTKETGNPDPHSYQNITLTKVGNLAVAVPDNQKLVE
jgi:arylsulfatase A-like enzyme